MLKVCFYIRMRKEMFHASILGASLGSKGLTNVYHILSIQNLQIKIRSLLLNLFSHIESNGHQCSFFPPRSPANSPANRPANSPANNLANSPVNSPANSQANSPANSPADSVSQYFLTFNICPLRSLKIKNYSVLAASGHFCWPSEKVGHKIFVY